MAKRLTGKILGAALADRDPFGSYQARCAGKEKFVSQKQAWVAARRRKGRRAYRCGFCDGWHVGTVMKKNRTIDE